MAHALEPMTDPGRPADPDALRVLMITSEWPTPEHPEWSPFIVRQVEFLRRAGVRVDVFAFRGSKSPISYARAWMEVRRRLSRDRYDLVHAQWGQSAVLALPKRVPLVITYRGNDLEGIVGPDGRYSLPGQVLRAVSRAASRAADQVMVVAEHLARLIPPRSYHVIPSGLDLEHFSPTPAAEARRALGLPLDRKLVLFAGVPANTRKRHALAQAAVSLLPAELNAELVVAAGIPHERIPLYMSACDTLVLTSMHEGSPNVVKEALACDLPVVSVDVGDVRQRIGRIEGCIVTVDDRPETIAAALERVLRRGGRVDGRSTVRELDERLLAQRTIGVYRQAIGR